MTQQPDPIQYQSFQSRQAVDLGHIKALAICHYVWGGLVMAISCIFIIHVVMGIMIARGAVPFAPPPTPTTAMAPGARPANAPPPPFFGYFMAAMGGCAILAGWTVGILTIISGRSISQLRRRTFSLVIAGINCASFPIGTVLGVFTFIVLLRPSVRDLYPPPAGR